MKVTNLSIGSTSTMRAKIAADIALSLFNNTHGKVPFQLRVVMGPSNTEIGGTGAPLVVGRKKYDCCFINPAAVARMAFLGRGYYKSKIPLRAIGVFPSWDKLVFAVRRDSGIRSLEEIKERKMPLTVSTRTGNQYHSTLFTVEAVLKEYGFGLSDIEKWGGKIHRVGRPGDRKGLLASGGIDAVFDEGIKSWGTEAIRSGMEFLPIRDDVMKKLERLGFTASTISPTHYPELSHEVPALDFSGWLFFCHRDLPASVTYQLAEAIDLCHREIPVDHFDRRPMTMQEFCQGSDGGPLTLPLHPGAKKYYQQKGYLTATAV